jgi:hypothetical protein
VDANGKGTLKAVTTRVTISDGPLSLFDNDGSAIIIHGNPDQMITGEPKSGVSGGPRVACGVIQKQGAERCRAPRGARCSVHGARVQVLRARCLVLRHGTKHPH